VLDHWAVALLVPLAVWILLSGLDDLFIGFVWLRTCRQEFPWPSGDDLDGAPQRPIAILVPLWHEHRVIGQMLDRNLASIRYSNYQVFAGVYANDHLTMRAVTEAAARDKRIRICRLPHDGPTSKGDCLNCIYSEMRAFEAAKWVRFEIILTHDAEDVIHPESLRLVNWFSRHYDMVQIPVLALPTPAREFTHGLYCDEFAEFQSKDIPVRQRLGGFLPGNGVGTGFVRETLDRLAVAREGRIFDPDCLTEDYENGFVLHSMGCRQVFVPLRFGGAAPVATREYFPRRLRAAVRQRSRWVAGIALQGWERHGWRTSWRQRYWFWRDRKGMVGNLLTPAANVLFLYGLAGPTLGASIPRWAGYVCAATLVISLLQMSLRTAAAARVYGFRFAAFVPLRMLWGNAVNFLATAAALRQFLGARLRKRNLLWRKTEHVYAAPAAVRGKERIGEVLVRLHTLPFKAVEQAAAAKPPGLRLGEYLVLQKQLSEENLYRALSSQAGIPVGVPGANEVNSRATHALPVEAALRWKVLPYRVDLGQLHVVTPEVPTEEMTRELSSLSTLQLRYRLVRPAEFESMVRQYILN
jgi:bacteriophage N4 adsorption protein B